MHAKITDMDADTWTALLQALLWAEHSIPDGSSLPPAHAHPTHLNDPASVILHCLLLCLLLMSNPLHAFKYGQQPLSSGLHEGDTTWCDTIHNNML